ncbi:MAG: hypothetical protein IT363_13005 [Methanoregulaceae archaeon]|nr:hypothetical protein [Methanoregulaceae archaeon]
MEITSQPLTLKNLLDVFRRHWFGMSVVFILCLIAGVVAYFVTPPMFRSRTMILVDSPVANLNDPVSEVTLPNLATDLVTQSGVIQSERILYEAFRTAGVSIPEGLTPELLQRLLPRVSAEPVPGTSIIEINVDTGTAATAMRVAQIIPEVYLSYQRSSRQAEVVKATTFVEQRLKEQTDAYKKSQADLNDFKKKRTLVPLEQEGQARSMMVSSAQQALVEAQATVVGAKEKLANLLKELEKIPDSRRLASRVANMEMLEGQRAQIAQLVARREELLEVYLPDRPEVKQVDAQLEVARQRLEEIPKEADTTTDTRPQSFFQLEESLISARTDLKAAQARESEVRKWLAGLERDLKMYNDIAIRQDELVRAVEENRVLLESITKAYEELRLRRNSAREPVSVLMQASNPSKISPQTTRPMGAAVLVGLFLAVAFALLKDGLDEKVVSSSEAGHIAGLPLLGEARILPNRLPGRAAEKLRTAMRESYRVLLFNLRYVAGDDPVRTIAVTSSRDGEFSPDVAFNLAAVAASAEHRVILVDANLRSPSVHRRIDRLREIPGLTDVVNGKAALLDCLQDSAIPGLRILTCGTPVENPADLFTSAKFQDVLRALQDSSEMVVLDAAPTLDLADMPAIAHNADAILYVARPGATRRPELRRGLETLRQAGGRVVGIVSTRLSKRAS